VYPSKLCSVEHYPQGKVIVTGSRGQDGSYLREFVGLENSVGIVNPRSMRSGNPSSSRELTIDISDYGQVRELLEAIRPKEIFHLAAWHGPSGQMTYSQEDKELMQRIHVAGTTNILRGLVELELDTHLVVAGSSRIYGRPSKDLVVDEDTPTNPIDYYGQSKEEAWNSVREFREAHRVRASFLVLFNHESPRRPPGYLSTTIALELASVIAGKQEEVRLRSPNSRGDWSDARDVVRAMLKASQLPSGEDFIIGSGNAQSVSDLVAQTCEKLNMPVPRIVALPGETNSENTTLIASPMKAKMEKVWSPMMQISDTLAEMTLQNISKT
jgi:GDPmannose 4,6-dehydratase